MWWRNSSSILISFFMMWKLTEHHGHRIWSAPITFCCIWQATKYTPHSFHTSFCHCAYVSEWCWPFWGRGQPLIMWAVVMTLWGAFFSASAQLAIHITICKYTLSSHWRANVAFVWVGSAWVASGSTVHAVNESCGVDACCHIILYVNAQKQEIVDPSPYKTHSTVSKVIL